MTPTLVSLMFILLLCLAACLSALATALHRLRERGAGHAGSLATGGNDPIQSHLRAPLHVLPEVLSLCYAVNLALGAAALWLWLSPWPRAWNPWWAGLFLLGAMLLVVEIVPRVCGIRQPAATARRTLPIFLALRFVASPVTSRLRRLGEQIAQRCTPRRLKPRQAILAEEVETLVDMREEQGAITSDEAALLRGLVGLHGMLVKDAMTPRVDLPLMPHDARDDEALRMLESARHRFVAVFDEKSDAIAFVLDTHCWKLAGRPHWTTLTSTPVFVPETLPLLDAWRDHLQDDASALVVVDEYGGFEGILSRVGLTARLLAKAAPAPDSSTTIQPAGQNLYLVDGSTRLEEIERELEVTLDAEGVDTIGGLVMNHFGYPPKPGETLSLEGLDIKVKRTTRARIQQLELRVTGEDVVS